MFLTGQEVYSTIIIVAASTLSLMLLDGSNFSGIDKCENPASRLVTRLHLAAATVSGCGTSEIIPKTLTAKMVLVPIMLLRMVGAQRIIEDALHDRSVRRAVWKGSRSK